MKLKTILMELLKPLARKVSGILLGLSLRVAPEQPLFDTLLELNRVSRDFDLVVIPVDVGYFEESLEQFAPGATDKTRLRALIQGLSYIESDLIEASRRALVYAGQAPRIYNPT